MALRCPRCSTTFAKPAAGAPVCPSCGHGGKAAPRAAPPPPGARGRGARLQAANDPVPGRLRQVSIGKAILLGIVTFGIYTYVLMYKMSGDLHRSQGGWAQWQLFFWLGFIPFIGAIFTYILYFKNNKQANALRQGQGLQAGYTPFVLAVIPIVNIAAPFVWTGYYNEAAQRT